MAHHTAKTMLRRRSSLESSASSASTARRGSASSSTRRSSMRDSLKKQTKRLSGLVVPKRRSSAGQQQPRRVSKSSTSVVVPVDDEEDFPSLCSFTSHQDETSSRDFGSSDSFLKSAADFEAIRDAARQLLPPLEAVGRTDSAGRRLSSISPKMILNGAVPTKKWDEEAPRKALARHSSLPPSLPTRCTDY
jgi:hypothetical protein